jgi:hypothetical protein
MANLSNINNKFLVTTTGEVLIGQTSNNGNRLQITGADGASYIYLKTDVATTGGRIGFNGDALRVFNQQASGELQLGTAGVSRVRISNSLVVFPTITELRGDIGSNKFAIGNMGDASSQMMVSSRGFLTFNVSNTGSALDATERMRIDSSGNVGIGTTPLSKVHISGSAATLTMQDADASSTSTSTILFRNLDGNSNYYQIAKIKGITSGNGGYGVISFETAFENSLSERMRIDGSGIINFSKTATTATPNASINHANNDFVYFTGGSGGASFGDSNHGTRMIAFNNDYLRFDTGGNGEKMRIDSNGSIGMGANSASYRLRVKSDATVDNGIYLSAGTGSGNHSLYVEDKDGTAEYFAVRGDGEIRLNASSGHTYAAQGIRFGANASANNLDDYEEGTWTPTSNLPGATVSSYGKYTKIGNIVYIAGKIDFTGKTGTAVNVVIDSLPFSGSNTNDAQTRPSAFPEGDLVNMVTLINNYGHFRVNGNQMQGVIVNSSGNTIYMSSDNFSSSGQFNFSVVYTAT